MSHGAPDYSNVLRSGLVFRLDDLSELAVRLGSLNVYDRRGDAIWFYDFSHGIEAFIDTALGAVSEYSLSTFLYEKPPFSCKLVCGTAENDYIQVTREVGVPQNPKMGFNTAFYASSGVEYFVLNLNHYDGTNKLSGSVQFNINDETIAILDENGDYQVIATDIGDINVTFFFSHIKLVCDFVNGTYGRVMIDGAVYDVSNYNLRQTASAEYSHILFSIFMSRLTVGTSVSYIDNVVITTNEL